MRRSNFVCLIAVFAAACGSSVSIDDFPTELANAFCTQAVACKNMPDMAACKASLDTKNRFLLTVVAKVKAGTIKYDEDKAGECIESVSNQGCTFTGFYVSGSDPCA